MGEARRSPDHLTVEAALALLKKGDELFTAGQHDEALAAYDELARRFSDADDPEVRWRGVLGYLWKGYRLGKLGRDEEAIAVYDEMAERFLGTSETSARELLAQALVNRAVALERLGRLEEAIKGYDVVVSEFGESTHAKTREHVAWALFDKAFALTGAKRAAEAVAAYDDLIVRFGDDTGSAIRPRVSWSLWNESLLFDEVGRSDERSAIYERLIARGDYTIDSSVGDIVRWCLRKRLMETGDERTIDSYIGVVDDLAEQFQDSDEPDERILTVRALGLKAYAFSRLGRTDEEIRVYDELLRRFKDAAEPEIRVTVAESFDRKARALDRLGDLDGALATYDEALEALSESREGRGVQVLVEALYNKGRALRRAERDAEAVVVFDSAIAAYRDLASHDDSPPKVRVTGVQSVLQKALALSRLNGSDDLTVVRDDLVAVLGAKDVVPERSAVRPERETTSEADLAALLAEVHSGDCWLLFATAGNDAEQHREMAARALALYRDTERWLGNVETWDEPSGRAAFVLRNVADGYAILSRWWSDRDRATLPLPTRPLLEWTLRFAGVDEWAEELGHPVELRESSDVIDATLEVQQDLVARHPELDDEATVGKVASGLLGSLYLYELFELLRWSEQGRAVLPDDAIKSFTSWELVDARRWAARAREHDEQAGPAGLAMILIAQFLFISAHADDWSAVTPFPSRQLLCDLVREFGLASWSAELGYELPGWVLPDEEDGGG